MAVRLEGFWQDKAGGEQALLPAYDPVDALLGLSGVGWASRLVVGRLGRGAIRASAHQGASELAFVQREATGFLGRSGVELKNAPWQKLRNETTRIGGRDFSGHALDQMQNRGIMPSVIENTLNVGTTFPTRGGTTGFYDSINNLRVIINPATGRVVTVIKGAPP